MKSYGQFCAVARALDVLGERWTFLLVRELLLGPRRFSDLLVGLPGIAPNLLTDRLRSLAREGVIERTTLEPPAASRVYRMTDRGEQLRPAVLALARWGMDPIAPPDPADQRQPAWYALALEAAYRPEHAQDVEERYQFIVDGTTFHIRVGAGRSRAALGPASDPSFVLHCGLDQFLGIATGASPPKPGQLEGSQTAFKRFRRAFSLPAPA